MPKMPTGPASLMPSLRRVVVVRESADRSDGQLLTAFVHDRDADAFAALVRRHGPMVLGVARRVIGDHHTADDAFQAVFLVLARRAAAVRPREQVGNWLYGVAYRTAIKARAVLARRRNREKQVDAMPEPPAPPTPDSWTDLQPVIDEELARLPDRLRLPVVLCDLEGRPQRSVAKQLGVAPATLAARLASARRTLAARLGRRGICLSGGALATVLGDRASATVIAPKLADATVRAAEAFAAGAGTHGLVSAHAIQLCEGVMRMMLLSKLKTTAVAVLSALALTCGLGFGMLPAQAGDGHQASPKAKPAHEPKLNALANRGVTDAEFLRRLMLDLTGTLPTKLEIRLFTADKDADKRVKVVNWLLADDGVKSYLAKALKLAPEQIKATYVFNRDTGKHQTVIQIVEASEPMKAGEAGKYSWIDVAMPTAYSIEYQRLIYPSQLGQAYSALMDIDNTLSPQQGGGGGATRQRLSLQLVAQPPTRDLAVTRFQTLVLLGDSDSDFLDRAIQSARGSAPTALEKNYFTEDKDPKKREKLLDLLLQDASLAKKLGGDWKKKMLEPKRNAIANLYQSASNGQRTLLFNLQGAQIVPLGVNHPEEPSKFEKLIGELIAAKKSDEQMLEALTLAAAGRLPTAEEKRATLAVIAVTKDKKAAWIALANSFAAEAKKK